MNEIRLGGRCQMHPLNILPCDKCAQGLPADCMPGVFTISEKKPMTNNEHTEQSERDELLKAHLVAMNALSDFVKRPHPDTERAMRQAEGEFRALLAATPAQQSPLSRFVHSPDSVREEIGQRVVDGAIQAQRALLAADKPAESGGEADAHLAALMRYTEAFYSAAMAHGMKAGPTADSVAHVERAARALHRLATNTKPQADKGGGGDSTDMAIEAYWGPLATRGVLSSSQIAEAVSQYHQSHPQPSELSDDVVKDAERYRWLREGDYPFSFAQRVLNDTPWGIDAAIDAAMLKEGE